MCEKPSHAKRTPSTRWTSPLLWRLEGRLYPEDCAQVGLKIGDLAAPTWWSRPGQKRLSNVPLTQSENITAHTCRGDAKTHHARLLESATFTALRRVKLSRSGKMGSCHQMFSICAKVTKRQCSKTDIHWFANSTKTKKSKL